MVLRIMYKSVLLSWNCHNLENWEHTLAHTHKHTLACSKCTSPLPPKLSSAITFDDGMCMLVVHAWLLSVVSTRQLACPLCCGGGSTELLHCQSRWTVRWLPAVDARLGLDLAEWRFHKMQSLGFFRSMYETAWNSVAGFVLSTTTTVVLFGCMKASLELCG